MTVPVLERHRRAAADALCEVGIYDASKAEALEPVAQAVADAEERGRMEERVRCLAWARHCKTFGTADETVVTIKYGQSAADSWLDAARKELGE